MKPMTVADLIAFLQAQPRDLLVVFQIYSEYALLEAKDIRVISACLPRADGWVHRARQDKEIQDYLML